MQRARRRTKQINMEMSPAKFGSNIIPTTTIILLYIHAQDQHAGEIYSALYSNAPNS